MKEKIENPPVTNLFPIEIIDTHKLKLLIHTHTHKLKIILTHTQIELYLHTQGFVNF